MSANLSPEQLDELKGLLAEGKKIAAIKAYREWHRCSLIDAKHLVEQIGRDEQVAVTRQHADDLSSGSLSETQMDEILIALERGGKLEAVKLYRKHAGCDLLTSKTFIESLMKELGAESLEGSGGGGGCASVVVFAATLATCVLIALLVV